MNSKKIYTEKEMNFIRASCAHEKREIWNEIVKMNLIRPLLSKTLDEYFETNEGKRKEKLKSKCMDLMDEFSEITKKLKTLCGIEDDTFPLSVQQERDDE